MSYDPLKNILGNEKEITYEECQKLWEDENTLVHHDTSERLIREVTDHIIKICELNHEDILLNIGCGDGLFDTRILSAVKCYYGVDFSEQKLTIARKNVPEGRYFQHNFLNPYCDEIRDAGITKIYSYSVVQYCKPEDVERFIYNQLCLCTEEREYLIAHLDVPDRSKAVNYYKKRYPDLTDDNDCSSVKTLFGDGSYWHDMQSFENAASKFGLECRIYPANYWDYRSDIVLRFKGKKW